MKILELTNFSAGICGVGARVKQEASLLKRNGHDVMIFSSNFVKGSNNLAPLTDSWEGVPIRRFPAIKLGGESYMKWDYKKEAIEFRPNLIIAHAYRHNHTNAAINIAKSIGAKVILVTHAPFVPNGSTRSLLSKIVVAYYDSFIGPSRLLKKFDKIIAITKWEMPYLTKLGVPKNKIEYVPNGIPDEFFSQKILSKEQNKLLFLGRISPIKNLETVIRSLKYVNDKTLVVEFVGPAEEDYLKELKDLIAIEKPKQKVIFSKPIYSITDKIKKLDSAKYFILPSLREAMPQSLIEAMSRKKIAIASKNMGSNDLIINEKNGFLFTVGDEHALAEIINSKPSKSIGLNAFRSVEKFKWSKVLISLEKLIKNI